MLRRSAADAAAAPALPSAVWQVGREQPLFRLMSFDAMLANRSAGEIATTKVLAILASIALVLAAVGTDGVLACTVAQRRVKSASGSRSALPSGVSSRSFCAPVSRWQPPDCSSASPLATA